MTTVNIPECDLAGPTQRQSDAAVGDILTEPLGVPGAALRASHFLAHLILPEPYKAGAIIISNLDRGINWPGSKVHTWPLDLESLGSSPVLPLTS